MQKELDVLKFSIFAPYIIYIHARIVNQIFSVFFFFTVRSIVI